MGIFSLHKNREKEAQERDFRRKTEEKLDKLEVEMRRAQDILGTLSQDVRQTGEDIRQHDRTLEDCRNAFEDQHMALEDFLDALEDQQEQKRKSQKQMKKLEDEQEKLLKLLSVYQEQLWGMKRYAEQKDSAWAEQFHLAAKAAEGCRLSSGIIWIEESGVQVDYELHEVIEVRTVSDERSDQTVAEVYSPGCIYQGNVRKKAKVAAYRLKKQEA